MRRHDHSRRANRVLNNARHTDNSRDNHGARRAYVLRHDVRKSHDHEHRRQYVDGVCHVNKYRLPDVDVHEYFHWVPNDDECFHLDWIPNDDERLDEHMVRNFHHVLKNVDWVPHDDEHLDLHWVPNDDECFHLDWVPNVDHHLDLHRVPNKYFDDLQDYGG